MSVMFLKHTHKFSTVWTVGVKSVEKKKSVAGQVAEDERVGYLRLA